MLAAVNTAMTNDIEMRRRAVFSPCRRYRYALWRHLGDSSGVGHERYAMFVGLNPSTADEFVDDPTIRRCIAFARAWGFDGLCMTNLFAYRATEPSDLLAQKDPTGPDNDRILAEVASNACIIVAAWGNHGDHLGRASIVMRTLPRLHYLRLNKNGQPGHPLYLPGGLTPVKWTSVSV